MIRTIEELPRHGGQIATLADRFGIPASKLLDFSANINPEGPPQVAIDALRTGIEDLSTLTEYPDLRGLALKRALAAYAGVEPTQIAVANGFVPLLEATLRTLPIRRCLLPLPAFGEYRSSLERAEIEVIPRVLSSESNFRYELEAMLDGLCDAVLLANPQNPSGVAHRLPEIEALVQRAAEHRMFVLLDEAFIDSLPGESLTPQAMRLPNLVVFRSITKFFAMPGLRIAYVVAHPNRIAQIDHHLAPWPISTLASQAAAAAVADRSYAHRTIELSQQRRVDLQQRLEALGLHIYPSSANFLLVRLPPARDGIALWQRLILEHHIVVRSCANYEGLPPGHLRVAVRRGHDNLRLVAALEHLLHPTRP